MKRTIATELFYDVPEIEFHIGYQYFLGNMNNYTKALMSILKSIRSKLPLLQMMCMSKEYEGLRTITQTLRKLLVNVGANAIADRTYELETILLNEDTTVIHNHVTGYMNELMDFAQRLESLIKKIESMNATGEEEDSPYCRYDYRKTINRILDTSQERYII